jgi:hypothetical protein
VTASNPFADVPLGVELKFEVERGTIEKGKTFSMEAVENVAEQIGTFILSQIAKRWDATNEPPTQLQVTVRCDLG